jgi:hypothetical protein
MAIDAPNSGSERAAEKIVSAFQKVLNRWVAGLNIQMPEFPFPAPADDQYVALKRLVQLIIEQEMKRGD